MSDEDVFKLLILADMAMNFRKFRPVIGDITHPEEWVVAIDGKKTRPAKDEDIVRAAMLSNTINSIDGIESHLGDHNPIRHALTLQTLDENPDLRGKITEGERKGMEIVAKVMREYRKKLGYSED